MEEARIDLLEVVAASPVDQRFGHRLVALAEERQVVTLSAGGQLLDLTYDYLVLAMGGGQDLRLADESAREHLRLWQPANPVGIGCRMLNRLL